MLSLVSGGAVLRAIALQAFGLSGWSGAHVFIPALSVLIRQCGHVITPP
ncbi:hypothetical protein ACFO4E_16135 [Nocardiopsis mangrovi]|uniref:Uncharacterized protein n=1 Tax=Nocardiopsis mangrovi TaxID=1179818 RepID=A0ABV9DYH7_9ACTN